MGSNFVTPFAIQLHCIDYRSMTEVQLPAQSGVRGCHALVEKKTIGGIDQCVCTAASHHRAFLVEDGVKGVAWEIHHRGKGYLQGKLIGTTSCFRIPCLPQTQRTPGTTGSL